MHPEMNLKYITNKPIDSTYRHCGIIDQQVAIR